MLCTGGALWWVLHAPKHLNFRSIFPKLSTFLVCISQQVAMALINAKASHIVWPPSRWQRMPVHVPVRRLDISSKRWAGKDSLQNSNIMDDSWPHQQSGTLPHITDCVKLHQYINIVCWLNWRVLCECDKPFCSFMCYALLYTNWKTIMPH